MRQLDLTQTKLLSSSQSYHPYINDSVLLNLTVKIFFWCLRYFVSHKLVSFYKLNTLNTTLSVHFVSGDHKLVLILLETGKLSFFEGFLVDLSCKIQIIENS